MPDIRTIAYKLPIEFDRNKLYYELENIVQKNAKGSSAAITNKKGTDESNWFNTRSGLMHVTKVLDTGEQVSKDFKRWTLGFPGEWKDNLESYFPDGTGDREMIEWHPLLAKSEMRSLGQRISDYFNLNTHLRCRASFLQGPKELFFHSDPHTPWRVHVNFKSGEGVKWVFKDDTGIVEWEQPSDEVWLIRTGNIMHNVKVPANQERWQLFYHIWKTNLDSKDYQIIW